jgi:putative oxidoreductase
MLRWLLWTDGSVVGLVLRLTLAVVIFPHGAQRVLGWFGGHGLTNTLQFFTDAGIPAILALLAIAAESLGPLGLAAGLLTRVAALGIVCVMLVAIITVH